MVDSGAVQNIVVFGDEVVVDVVINNPSLQAKKTHRSRGDESHSRRSKRESQSSGKCKSNRPRSY